MPIEHQYSRDGAGSNGHLYIRYRSSYQKNKAEECKSLQTTSLCYFIAKSTQTFPLTFIKLEKTKHENFGYGWSADENHSYCTCFQLLVCYYWWALLRESYYLWLMSYASCARLSASGTSVHVFWVWYIYSGHTQTTECMNGCEVLASNQQWVFSK